MVDGKELVNSPLGGAFWLDPERCPRCFLKKPVCLCASVPRVEGRTRLLLVRHAMERFKNSNTGRLAVMALAGAQVVEYGTKRDEDVAEVIGALPKPTYVLYPDGAEVREPPAEPISLIVLDGSWPQARRMLQRIDALRGLPRLALPAPTRQRARLRRGRHVGEMSTLEAIAQAVSFLEGEAMAEPLFALFDDFVERSTPEHDRKRVGGKRPGVT